MICCVFYVCTGACVYLYVYMCVLVHVFSMCGYGTTYIKLNFRVSGSSIGRVSACVCICWYDLSIGGYKTTDKKLLNFCC